jgi:hypothetical protein
MTKDRSRLAAWCLGMSIITAAAVWALMGAPEPQAAALWHAPSFNPGPP